MSAKAVAIHLVVPDNHLVSEGGLSHNGRAFFLWGYIESKIALFPHYGLNISLLVAFGGSKISGIGLE
jgi:hypothetical protein